MVVVVDEVVVDVVVVLDVVVDDEVVDVVDVVEVVDVVVVVGSVVVVPPAQVFVQLPPIWLLGPQPRHSSSVLKKHDMAEPFWNLAQACSHED